MRTFYALVLGTALIAGPQTPRKPRTKPAPQSTASLAAPERLASVEGITEYRLANGLRVLLFPDASKPTLTVNITYMVGSRHESYGETGMAHLLEHLVFKPSKRFSGKDGNPTPVQVLNQVGARFNGTTSQDRTNYFITFPATAENQRRILELEADRMVNANIDALDLWNPKENKGEMTVVRNEMEGGENSPIRITLQRTMAAAFDWHNYGKDTIGARADVEHVNIARLKGFYARYYQPDNAVLLLAGKFDEAATLAQINQVFGAIPRPARTLESTWTVDPPQDGERQVTIRRVGDVQALMAAYKIPAGTSAESAALEVLDSVMSSTPGGRLHKALVESKKAAFVFGFGGTTAEPGLQIFGTQIPKTGNADEAKALLLDTLEQAAQHPVTREEVERARQELLKGIELSLNESDRTGIALSEYIAQGDWRLFFLQRDRIRKVTVDEVQAAAVKYFKRENRTLGQFIPTEKPDRAEMPAAVAAADLVKDYKGGERVAAGEAFDASPANIDGRTRTFTLPSGLKVAFLPKKTRGESVNLRLLFHLGSEASLNGQDVAGSLAGALLMRGTTRLTRQQIKDEFDRLKAQAFAAGNAENAFAMATTTRTNLAATLDLLAEVLKSPAFPQEELDKLVSEQSAGLESQAREPGYKASFALRQHLNPYPAGHPRYPLSLEESLAALKAAKLEDVKAFHARFYGASAGELTLVGDFDEAAMEALLRKHFGDWKPKEAFVRIPQRLPKPAAPLDAKAETPDKAQAVFLASLPLPMQDTDPDYPAMVLGNHLLGGGAINSRIANELRQNLGLSYGAGSQFQAGSQDAVGQWSANAIYAPENLGRLREAFFAVVAKALKEGFTAEEIAAAKTAWLQSRATARANDRELAGALSNNLFLGRTMAWNAALEAKVQALTPDQIVEALRRHLDPAKLNVSVAGDFAKKK